MWLMLPDCFLSIVRHRELEEKFLVRARRKEHLQHFFLDGKIKHTPHADYPYRAVATPNDVRSIFAAAMSELEYDNFKNEAHRRVGGTNAFVSALHQVWAVMRGTEDRGARSVIPSGDEQPGPGQEHPRSAHPAGQERDRPAPQGRRARTRA
jgi:hypothetical protein